MDAGAYWPLQQQVYRVRLARAFAEICHQDGAQAATVARLVHRAGCSRSTFYDLFANRDACHLAALEEAVQLAEASARPAYLAERDWINAVRAGLRAVLEVFDAEPELASVCLVLPPVGAPPVLAYRSAVLARLAEVVDRARAVARLNPPALTSQVLVGGAVAVVHDRVVLARKEPLIDLLQPLMAMIVMPYLGPDRASRELRRPSPAVRSPPPAPPLRPVLVRPPLRLTLRTLLVFAAIASRPGMSNREVARAAGITDDAQISKLLSRLCRAGLLQNTGEGQAAGRPNAWHLTDAGEDLVRSTAMIGDAAT